MTCEVKKFRKVNELSEAAATSVADLIVNTVSSAGRFSFVLSGGSTPRTLYNLLGTVHRERIPWESVSIYFGDERYVPHTVEESNYRMAKEALLDLISIPMENVHPIPTEHPDPKRAAEAYEKELRSSFPEDGISFDLVLLGMGKEGHTASLFPGSEALDEDRRWVMSVEVPPVPHKRITLTYPILNRSAAIYFLVSGAEKRDAMRQVFSESSDFHVYPAKGIAPVAGRLEWWVDSEAWAG